MRHDADGLRMSLQAIAGVPTDFSLEAMFPVIEIAGRKVHDVETTGRLDATRGSISSPVFLIDGDKGTIGGGQARFDVELEPATERYRPMRPSPTWT